MYKWWIFVVGIRNDVVDVGRVDIVYVVYGYGICILL